MRSDEYVKEILTRNREQPRLPDEPLVLCSKVDMARRLHMKPMRCPVESCTGLLIVRHPTDFAQQEGGRVGSDLVPLFSLGCTGLTMHLWRKEDLFYLRPMQPRVVTNLKAVSNEILPPGAPTPPPALPSRPPIEAPVIATPPGWETSPGHHIQE